jgi:hypothetical protein
MKVGTKAAKSIHPMDPSRSSSVLKGSEFMNGVIKSVTKGRGDWRHIVLEDGTAYPVSKDIVTDLVRSAGTKGKMTELGTKKGESAINQALQSLAYHESRSNPYMPKKSIRSNYKDYVRQVKESGAGDAIPYSLVERGGKQFTLPTPYAELLEKEGHVKILESLK